MVTTATRPRAQAQPRVGVTRVPRLCLALQAPTMEELVAKAENATREVDFLEFRLDALKQPSGAGAALEQFLRSSPRTTAVATCRRQACGGGFKGTVEAEVAILKAAAKAGCGLVDIELQSAERLGENGLAELRRHAGLVISHHDFKTTPALAPLLTRLRRFEADFYKLVPTATAFKHNLNLLEVLEDASAENPLENLVAFCMGEAGLPSRLLSLRAGTAFTFGALSAGDATAPGQPTLEELRTLYRVDTLNRATQVYGVLGFPLAHSLSPRMQNAAFRRAGVNAIYLPLATRRPEEVLQAAHAIPLNGLSVTHPHKSAFLKKLERLDPLAESVGAINTVVRSQGKFYGYNTDVA
ncbi:MAG: type I 3-dehydroquinate dehydratase, partial [Terriglobales bacterium]